MQVSRSDFEDPAQNLNAININVWPGGCEDLSHEAEGLSRGGPGNVCGKLVQVIQNMVGTRELVGCGHTVKRISSMSDLVTLTTDNDMRVEESDRCRVIRVRSEIVISQLLCRFLILSSRWMLNLYTTDYSLYFLNCWQTEKAVRRTQFLGYWDVKSRDLIYARLFILVLTPSIYNIWYNHRALIPTAY